MEKVLISVILHLFSYLESWKAAIKTQFSQNVVLNINFKINKFLAQDLPQFLAQEDPKNKKGSKNNLKTFIYK